MTQRAVWIAALAMGALLLLARLDGVRLWQDEAETALLGRNPATATLALFLLSTSLPFLLYSRQCR